MVYPPDRWNPVIINALRMFVGVLGYPKGAAAELWMALLSSVTVPLFLPHFSPLGLYPRLVMVVVKGSLLLLVISLMKEVTRVNGSGLPGRHVQVHLLMSLRIQGIQRRGHGKDCAPLPPKEWGVRSASLAVFFLDLGLGEVLHWERLEPALGGTGVGVPAGQSSRRG